MATAVFVGSYFFSRPWLLRLFQMLGAGVWIVYGVLIHATPVIAANVLVLSAAAWTARLGQERGERTSTLVAPPARNSDGMRRTRR